jgi:hypothetical protein
MVPGRVEMHEICSPEQPLTIAIHVKAQSPVSNGEPCQP